MLYVDGGFPASYPDVASVPATVHGFRIESETARYLILTTPRHGEFYRAITLTSRPGGLPPLESVEGSYRVSRKDGMN